MLQLGYKASAEQFGPRALLEFAVHAEQCGFDSVAVSDHFHPWRHTDGHAPQAFVWLGALCERTRRVRLGTSVTTPTFRYHPAVVAQAAATLALLSGDRFFLGVGTGESMNEVPALGITWPSFKERFARLAEAIALMQRLWREEAVTFEGRYYRTHRATLYDRPARGVPLFVAAAGATAAELAGRVGDGFICTSGKDWALYRETLLPALARGAAQAGRDPATIERLIEIKVAYDTDLDRARADTRHWAALALAPEEKVGIDDPRELEARAAAVADQAHRRWIVSADPDEVVERLVPYVELGFTHLVFHAPGPDQRRFLDLFARDVLPRLRRRFG
ncbi:MAG TPA: glucose-6-phosphate dehydrogenase (coenzyme-F420) [Chloroflexota bacterium]|nr:glucose-6-phosphate dehydrogenase (coenzyme-F420) [Chloroflexota bacterium]HZU05925.1 glucose-6-phosphate dehydrogenase (coenzyme-F420) [Chloroflexota bacterium]